LKRKSSKEEFLASCAALTVAGDEYQHWPPISTARSLFSGTRANIASDLRRRRPAGYWLNKCAMA
jgi:hypothetical protein